MIVVFMGSRKFPKENGMDKYLAGRGGSNDAYTDAEHVSGSSVVMVTQSCPID